MAAQNKKTRVALFPCERAVWELLPMIRADMAKQLVKDGIKRKDVAALLGVTPAAVSQYIHGKRGDGKKPTKDYSEKIKNGAKAISCGDQETVTNVICSVCKHCSKG